MPPAKHTEHPQADQVGEGIDPTRRNPAILFGVLRREEAGTVPLAQLISGQPCETLDVLRAEELNDIMSARHIRLGRCENGNQRQPQKAYRQTPGASNFPFAG
jgi:hypothetical protein